MARTETLMIRVGWHDAGLHALRRSGTGVSAPYGSDVVGPGPLASLRIGVADILVGSSPDSDGEVHRRFHR
jgi:hypothetical protein